jgi:hypothetical protein
VREVWAVCFLCLLSLTGCGVAPSRTPSPPPGPSTSASVSVQIITPTLETSEKKLFLAGDRAIAERRWRDAVEAYELLVAAVAASPYVHEALYGLGTAYEALGERTLARTRYRELATRFASSVHARAALIRAIDLHAYIEEWAALGTAGDELLARNDLGLVDRILGLGARALADIEIGDDAGASHYVHAGLDLAEENRLGESGATSVALAQLRFTLGEIRRVRSERITFLAPAHAFGAQLEARCSGLLDAQRAYADAMRSADPHWAAMAGFRVGEMYRALHRDVISVPAPAKVKLEKEKQIFFAAMHLRYRVLLEKGLKMMNATLELVDRSHDESQWRTRTESAKREIENSLDMEKATLASFPFTEAEMTRALDLLVARSERNAGKGK